MADPKTVHVWLPQGRSLCDRRAYPREAVEADGPQPEEELAAAPACGACLVLASAIRGNAFMVLQKQPSVWPETAVDAVRILDGTVWAGLIDETEWKDRNWTSLSVQYSEQGTENASAKAAKRSDRRPQA